MNQKGTGSVRALSVGVAIGMLVSLVITLLLTAVVGWMVSEERLQENSIDVGVIAIQVISAITGAAVAYSLVRSGRLLVCLATGAGYFLLLLACTALFFGGQYAGIWSSALAVLAGSLIVGLLGLREKKRGAVNRRKFKNR